MAIRFMRYRDASILRKPALPIKEITAGTIRLLDDMLDTMHKYFGVGLAAPQVGISKQVIVIEHAEKVYELINPVLLSSEGEVITEEGCLSFPGIWGEVKRFAKVSVKALDREGEEYTIEAEGRLAVILQHEIDHLKGEVFVDKVIRFTDPHAEPKEEQKMSKKRVIFMGTPDFSVTVLRALLQSDYQVVMVVSQPDRPKGRRMHLSMSAVKEAALQLGIAAIYQPENLRSAEAKAPILACEADYIVTAAFGQLLPDRILKHAKVAAINVHASLLPSYRGSAPIHRALLNGDQQTGVTTMLMVHAMDAGDVLLQQSCAIEPTDNVGSLYEKLAQIGAKLLLETMDRYENSTITPQPQDESKVTYAAAIKTEDQKINWQESAERIFNHIRALNPEPGAFCIFRGKNMKLWQSSVEAEDGVGLTGEILQADQQGLLVQCGSGRLRLTEIQPAGKNKMEAAAFIRGNKVEKGELLS